MSDVSPQPPVRTCGTMPNHERLLRTDEAYRIARIESENRAWALAALDQAPLRTGTTVIPVVVHVVWNQPRDNISDAQIRSQIDVLNQDFRRANDDLASIPAPFRALSADARIEFQLADTDPAGDATTGIVRTRTSTTAFDNDDQVKARASGGSDAWPAARYLNLWVCPLAGGLLGYSQFPGGPAATDGVVIRPSAFGTNGAATAPFDLGRTTTHEVGHWLNLRHIWGDDANGCNGDDFVSDTPNCGGPNTGLPSFPHISCGNGPNGDLFVNFMDYTDDAGMFMFTNGQVVRMQACLDGDRAGIGFAKAAPR
jgi:hypothetical protein